MEFGAPHLNFEDPLRRSKIFISKFGDRLFLQDGWQVVAAGP